MRSREGFEVRVSRKLLLLINSVGLLFFLVGLDLAFLHVIFAPDVGSGNVVLKWIFSLFAIGIGALILLTQSWYLIFPPLMMRVSSEGVSLGTGLRYRQELIPLRYLESVQIFRTESMLEIGGKTRVVEGGVELGFERTGEIPGALVTSAGISYSDYTLRLNKAYMNRSPSKTVEAVSGFIRSRRLR